MRLPRPALLDEMQARYAGTVVVARDLDVYGEGDRNREDPR
jgi:hypothetical protein